MFHGVLALLGRSLRIDARSWQFHLMRLSLVLGIYVAMISAISTSFRTAAPGLHFFYAVVWLNVVFTTLLGIGYFATTISEEREEDTLGLMQMAGISPLGILLGKLGGRLFQALLLIAVQFPFTLLAATVGGVTPNQVRCSFVGLTAYMLFLAGLGLLCSTLSSKNRTASTRMILGLIAYFVIPYLAYETERLLIKNELAVSQATWVRLLGWIKSSCVFFDLAKIMETDFRETEWRVQSVSNLVAAGICFGLSWALFNVASNPRTFEISSQRVRWRLFSPGRPLWNPFVWKDFHFVGGGLRMMLFRIVFYFALLLISFVLSELLFGTSVGVYDPSVLIFEVFLLFAVSIESALLMSRSIHDEVRGQTLSAMLMLPNSRFYIFYSKLAGALVAGLPGFCFLAAAAFCTSTGHRNLEELFWNPDISCFWLAHFILVPHLAMAFALYLRWGMIPLAIGIAVASVFVFTAMIDRSTISKEKQIGSVAVAIAGVCVYCHIWVRYKMTSVAARW